MDRIFKQEGVIDEDSMSEEENTTPIDNEIKAENEVIGHMQSKDGEDLGELVVINKNTTKIKVKPKPGICMKLFIKLLMHFHIFMIIIASTKKKRKFECEICGRAFLHAGRLELHKSFHRNVKYQCNTEGCLVESEDREILENHHKDTGHIGTTLIESLDYVSFVSKDITYSFSRSLDFFKPQTFSIAFVSGLRAAHCK